MPLDWNALMNDEKVLRMNNEQLGMYVRLLHRAWFADEPASLPADDSTLASISQVTADVWNASKTVVLAPFRYRAGRYHQKKMSEVYNAVIKKLEQRSESGKAGAEKRWNSNGLNGGAIAEPKIRDSNRIEWNRSTNDKASGKAKKLSREEKELADEIEGLLGDGWVNDAGKWISRIKTEIEKARRVIAEVGCAAGERRIKETPAQYAEQAWKEFT